MKRFIMVLAVAAVMLVVTAVPAFATIHQLAEMERANDNASPVVQVQDPPGVSDGPAQLPAEQGNESQNSAELNEQSPNPIANCNPKIGPVAPSCSGNFAQPIVAVGQNPSDASTNAFEATNPGAK